MAVQRAVTALAVYGFADDDEQFADQHDNMTDKLNHVCLLYLEVFSQDRNRGTRPFAVFLLFSFWRFLPTLRRPH